MTKEQSERLIFDALAKSAGLIVDSRSIVQNKPPSPDIEVVVERLGPLSVELLSLDSPTAHTQRNNRNHAERAWKTALDQRRIRDQEKLVLVCSNVDLLVQVSEQDGKRAQIRLMTYIQDQLLTLPRDFEGCLADFCDHAADGTRLVNFAAPQVWRGDDIQHGPRIRTMSSSVWQMPQFSKIEEKLRVKIYTAAAPLELFAYSVRDSPDGHVDSMAKIEQCIAKHLPTSAFQRVRIFDLSFSSKQLLVYP